MKTHEYLLIEKRSLKWNSLSLDLDSYMSLGNKRHSFYVLGMRSMDLCCDSGIVILYDPNTELKFLHVILSNLNSNLTDVICPGYKFETIYDFLPILISYYKLMKLNHKIVNVTGFIDNETKKIIELEYKNKFDKACINLNSFIDSFAYIKSSKDLFVGLELEGNDL